MKIAASILSADFAQLAGQIALAEQGGADWVHCDVMDGHFVPNITIGPLIVAAARKSTRLPIDVHLMIEKPENYIPAFRDAGADTITVHVEACPHLHRVVHQILETGARAGVALNPATSLSAVEEILPDIDLLLIMTVNPGFGAQKFIEASINKIKKARQMILATGKSIAIEVDGGIDVQTAPRVVAAGAEILVAGNSIGQPDIVAACMAIRKACRDESLSAALLFI